ncbi:hypothetical protein ACHAXT_006371 [Thalassiosira profunda]
MIAVARGAAFILLLTSRRSTSSERGTWRSPPLRIAYRIHRPSLLPNPHPQPAPLIVVHGGPSLPSEYLTPLAECRHLQNRAIILYDQLGCGWSSIPRQDEWYSVEHMGEDLGELIRHLGESWKMDRFHLLGHSLGGAIGYEYLKRQIEKGGERSGEGSVLQCLSLILSNASTNFQLSSSEQMRMFQEFQLQHFQTAMPTKKEQRQRPPSIRDQFFHTHICRTPDKPAELESALTRRGKEWSANDYALSPLDAGAMKLAEADGHFPPVLLIRGQHDFVTKECTSGWKDVLALPSEDGPVFKDIVLEDCAHYPHFEQPDTYSHEINKFCTMAERDEQ